VSFILDALRKSEHARQSLGNTSLAELPIGRRARRQPWWIFAIAALLLINLVVLVVVLMRDNTAKPAATNRVATASAPPSAVAPAASAAPAVNTAPRVATTTMRPLADEASPPQVRYDTVERENIPSSMSVPEGPALVKRIDEPALGAGSVVTMAPNGLPELHIDMHVYANNPADRFVFINMHKYIEGEVIAEGPRVSEITSDGVTLFYKGQQVHLHRP